MISIRAKPHADSQARFEVLDRSMARTSLIVAIRDLMKRGELRPGGRLPSEQEFQKRFRLNRHYLRQALQELTSYGIVETRPQSGSYLADRGEKALAALMTNVLALRDPDYESLADTRTVLEARAAELAARNADADGLALLQRILGELRREVEAGRRGLDEDYELHLTIARLSGSSVLISVISSLVPICLRYSESVRPTVSNYRRALDEHVAIVEGITARDPAAARHAMLTHMERNFAATLELLRNPAPPA